LVFYLNKSRFRRQREINWSRCRIRTKAGCYWS